MAGAGAETATEFFFCHFSFPLALQIFTEKPEVHRAFLAKVPHELSEKEFWTAYFKEQYKRIALR